MDSAKIGGTPHRAYFGQLRVFFYLSAPALIICEMPVEHIHLKQRGGINHFFQIRDGEKMAGAVNHKGTIRVGRLVTDAHAWNPPYASGYELPDRLHRVKQPARRAGADCNPLRADMQPVALRAG